jgi:hypothetical protein
MKNRLICVAMVAILTLPMATLALASNTAGPPGPKAAIEKGAYTATKDIIFTLDAPHQVQRYRVTCSDATLLDVKLADCCTPGDHWEARAFIHDKNPQLAITTAPGGADVFGVPARVYTYGGKPLEVLVEVRYLHGLNSFPSGGTVRFVTNGTCSPDITDLGLSDF